jgi:hypothetical protein
MNWRKFPVLLRCTAATWIVIVLTCDYGHAQLVDRAGAETIMRELMPVNSRCGQTPWEALSYCRYDTANTSNVVFELSFGEDGPAGSLTYNMGNTEGRQFLSSMRLYFLKAGVPKSVLDKCVTQSKSSSEALAVNGWIKCRYADFVDRVGYEISAERSVQSGSVAGSGAPH